MIKFDSIDPKTMDQRKMGYDWNWTMGSYLRPTVPKFRRSWKIDSKFRLRYRIEFCQKSPFRRKSRVSQGHKISAKFWELWKITEITEIPLFCYSTIFQSWNYCPDQRTPSCDEKKTFQMGDYSSMAWSMKKLAKLLTDKIRQTNPTTTVVGSEDRIRTRFTPVKALK